MPVVKKETPTPEESKLKICNPEKVEDAVNALKILNKKYVEEDMKKQPLLENTSESPVYLQVTLKKIPPSQLLRVIRVPLPHSLITETSEVCLFTGDLEKRNHKAEIEPTVLHYKDLLQKLGVTKVTKVIPLRELRTEYKTYESRRQLAAAYDVFLADKKIAGVLAKTLGKSFSNKGKFPVQIDMKRQNLKDQIDKALCQTHRILTCHGNSFALEVARLCWESGTITKNIMACIDVLGKNIPGKCNNFSGLYLKTSKSKAIPIYLSLDSAGDVMIKKPCKNKNFNLGELSTVDDAEVKVFRDGRVVLKKRKKGADSDEDTVENINLNKLSSSDFQVDSEKDSGDSAIKASPKKKRKKSANLDEIINFKTEDDIQESVKISQKKKGKKAVNLDKETNSVEVKTEDDIQESVKISQKKGKKAVSLDKETNSVEVKKEEDIQGSVTKKASLKKNKKGKVIHFDQVKTNMVENEIQDSVTIEVSSKKKKKGKQANIGQVTEKIMDTEDIQISSSNRSSSKKNNKKNMNSSQVEANKDQEVAGECTLVTKKKNTNMNIKDKVVKERKMSRKGRINS